MSEDAKSGSPSSAEDAATETDLRRLFHLSLDLMCVASFEGYFKKVNPAFVEVLGYERDELLSRQFIEFVHPDDRARTAREVERLSDGSVTLDFENRYRTRQGEYRWLAWRAAPMVSSGLIYAVARDVTEQRRVQAQLERQTRELERSNADLEQFAYVASHDLRAPLRSIVSLASFIESDVGSELPEASLEHLQELKRRALSMKALTDDLLVYSSAGREGEEITEVDTAELVAEIAFVLDPPEGLSVVTSGRMPRFETARGPLAQVLRNLIDNAIKHHDRDLGTVTVSAEPREESWEFIVSDDGPGVAAEDRDRVFSVFRRRDVEGRLEGAGMGLALVERIVRGVGCTVTLDPESGRGATFRFTWPARIDEGDRSD